MNDAAEPVDRRYEILPDCMLPDGGNGPCAGYTFLRNKPIDMILFCPNCGLQHVDKATADWLNPPHKSHLCHGCGYIWRPADVPTNGVGEIKSKGKHDAVICRGRAPATLTEQHRCVDIVRAVETHDSPRVAELLRGIIGRMRQRP